MRQPSVTSLTFALSLLTVQTGHAFDATQTEIDAFIAADQDKNLSLSRAEFPTFVRHMARAGQPTARTIVRFKAFGYAFNIADLNGDGRITPEELRAADDSYRAQN